MKKYKLVFIGAGSFRFTIPCFLNILDFAKSFHPVELWLVDINATSLAIMSTVIKQMIRYSRQVIEVFSTTDRKKALPDANYVLISISVGAQETEWTDIHIPQKFGVPQNTGDTVGPGGIFRGIRTIPFMIDFLKDINELCSNAFVLNFTNPQGTLMLSAFQAAPKVQMGGLCHEIFYLRKKKFGRFLRACNVIPSDKKKFTLSYGGLNHFAWITKLEYDGKDVYPQMREQAEYAYNSGKFGRPFNYYLLKTHGYFCYVEDRHVAEFMPQYYNFFNYRQEPFGIKFRNVKGIDRQRKTMYSFLKWANKRRNHWIMKLAAHPMEGGERALLMAKDKENDYHRQHVTNLLNDGIIPSLPDNCVVEVPCYFKNGKLFASRVGSLPNKINDIVKIHAENQQLVVDAAISGDPNDILKALLADPMCQFIEDEEKIEAMMWNMLYYQKNWLSQFSESIPSINDLKTLKYYIDIKEMITKELARMEKYPVNPSLKGKAWPQIE